MVEMTRKFKIKFKEVIYLCTSTKNLFNILIDNKIDNFMQSVNVTDEQCYDAIFYNYATFVLKSYNFFRHYLSTMLHFQTIFMNIYMF